MKKRTFVLGLAALLALAMVFTSCGSAADGNDGNSYTGSVVLLSGDIDAVTLKQAFGDSAARASYAGNVILASGVTSVEGEVPLGRKLIALPAALKVANTGTGALVIEGELELAEGVQFDAAGGVLTAATGTITIGEKGAVTLNSNSGIAVDDAALLAKVDATASGAVKSIGATDANVVTALGAADTVTVTTLGISGTNNTAIAAALTSGKQLVLIGATTVSDSLNLGTAAGTLLISGGTATIGGAYTLTGAASAANIVVGPAATLKLNNASAALAGSIKVNGTLEVGGVTVGTALPAGLDLTTGTLLFSADTGVVKFPAAKLTVKDVTVTGAGTIQVATAIEITGTLSNTAAKTLTLPVLAADKISIGTIVTHVSNSLTLAGATGATIGTYAGGAGGLTLPGTFTVAGAGNATNGTVLFTQDAVVVKAVSTAASVTTVQIGDTAQSANIVIGSAAKLKGSITDAEYAKFAPAQIARLASGSSLTYKNSQLGSGQAVAIDIPAGVTLAGTDTGNTWEDVTSVTLGDGAVFTPGAAATFEDATSIDIGTGAKLDFTTGVAFNITAGNSIRSEGTGKVVVTTYQNLSKVLAKATTESGEILTVEVGTIADVATGEILASTTVVVPTGVTATVVNGATLTVTGAVNVTAGGTLAVTGATGAGVITNNGTINVEGVSAVLNVTAGEADSTNDATIGGTGAITIGDSGALNVTGGTSSNGAAGVASIANTVKVTVDGGTLAVLGGDGGTNSGGDDNGGAATVAWVDAKSGSTISATGGGGATQGAGGAATIGEASSGKKIAFGGTSSTPVSLTVVGGACSTGYGGAATIYTSDTVANGSVADKSDAVDVITGTGVYVQVTIANDGTGSTAVGNATNKSIIVGGHTS
jgi:hypothetical protein